MVFLMGFYEFFMGFYGVFNGFLWVFQVVSEGAWLVFRWFQRLENVFSKRLAGVWKQL